MAFHLIAAIWEPYRQGRERRIKVGIKLGEGIASIEKKNSHQVCACAISIHFKKLHRNSYEMKKCRQSQRDHSQHVSLNKGIPTVIQKMFENSTKVWQSSVCPSLSLCGFTGICRTGAWATGFKLYSGWGFSWYGVQRYHLVLPSVSYSVITDESNVAEEGMLTLQYTIMPPFPIQTHLCLQRGWNIMLTLFFSSLLVKK